MMTLGQRLKLLRQELDNTQVQMGEEGVISTPGWVKLESGQRAPSEKLIGKLVDRMVQRSSFTRKSAEALRAELLTLKCLGSKSPFVRRLAETHARENGMAHLLVPQPAVRAVRGRPAATGKAVTA